MNKQKSIDSFTLKKELDSQYHSLIIDSPSDSVEKFINTKLYDLSQELKDDGIRSSHMKKKIDSILSMTMDERFALAISDMQKRSLAIPDKYNHLKTQNTHDADRDIIISPRMLRNKVLTYGIPYTAIIFVIGIVVGYVIFGR